LDDYFRQARELEAKQDFAGAEKVYRAAAAGFPKQPEVLKRLGLVLQTELKFPESIDTFQQVLQQAPQYPEVNFYLGLSYLGKNEFEKVLAILQDKLHLNVRGIDAADRFLNLLAGVSDPEKKRKAIGGS
jgi:tetratricopeptide (TPR) repeat protein